MCIGNFCSIGNFIDVGILHTQCNIVCYGIIKQNWLLCYNTHQTAQRKKRNITPRYDQRTFDITEREGKWQVVVSPREEDNALWINQDARFSLTTLKTGDNILYENAFAGNGVYLVVINGSVELDGVKYDKRDAVGIYEADNFEIKILEDAELLAVEVPMKF